jgi:uncharacterized membrane protein
MNRSGKYAGTIIVLIHLLINVIHGVAHRELHISLSPSGSVFVIVVILILPLVAMVLLWTARKQFGLLLLSFSMFASFLFGLCHHFVVTSPDHVHSQPSSPWGIAFLFTAYGLLITEAIGTYAGIHFLSTANQSPTQTAKTEFR